METKMNRLVRILQVEYLLFWLLALLLVALYECGILIEGGYVGDAQSTYLLQTAAILLTVALIPISLRMFSFSLVKQIRQLHLADALKSYRRWSEIRIALLLVALLVNLSSYYLTQDNIGLLCGSMVLTASLFCIPSRKRMQEELDIIKEEESI
ncbi:MAG: hypothetical protein ACRCZY_09825 [Phocaeicola sp.]